MMRWFLLIVIIMTKCNSSRSLQSFDKRTTLSRLEAREVYDNFAVTGHKTGGKDADSGYGGPAITALIQMAHFWDQEHQPQQTTTQQLEEHTTSPTLRVLDFGCGQGKLAELVLSKNRQTSTTTAIHWLGIDQSPKMVEGFQKRCIDQFGSNACSIELLQSGNPKDILDRKNVQHHSIDRFISTYCLDLLSEEDIYDTLDVAEQTLKKSGGGLLLLAGITWGYKDSIQTFAMTVVWELLYRILRKKVGGCRPQNLEPYLKEKGWEIIESVRTQPNGFPWMVSEVISAKPPRGSS